MIERHDINWIAIASAIHHYEQISYKYIEVPWLIPRDDIMVTCPDEDHLDQLQNTDSCLLGSAEQAFISLQRQDKLQPGKFVACSPCFRKEIYDDWHHRSFAKVELYQNTDVCEESLKNMINDALGLFKFLIPNRYASNFKIVQMGSDMFDINYKGIELGSYGIRSHGDLKWVYGTGLAEPRFSYATNACN